MGKIPHFGDWEVSQEADKINLQLTRELGGEDRCFTDVRARSVFEARGLRQVVFAELPEDVRKKVIEAIQKCRGFRYGVPSGEALSGEAAWPAHIEVSANDDYSTLYFYIDRPDVNSYGHVSWSCLRDLGEGYKFYSINHDSHVADVAYYLSIHEAQAKAAARTRDEVEKTIQR